VYLEAGVFTVSLTVETAHASDTVIMTDFIEVGITQPTAALSVDNRRALPGDTLQFTDRSVPGTAPVTAWAWSFGDGSVSTDLNPAHQYASEGSYEVALRVTTAHGEDVVVEPAYIVVTAGTALDAYVRQEDPSYNYVGVNTITGTPGVVGHVIDMISQTWRAETEVDEPMWDHWLTIIEPAAVTQSTALLFVAAGDMYGDAPTMINANLADLATATGSVVAVVEQTPGQPLQFANDSFPRSGNALIAHSFDRFLTSFEAAEQDDFRTVPDFSWPALLPMVKAAVRAMDTVQTFLDDDRSSNKVVVENFVVSGLGIRGWTAWLTAIVDGRVTGAVPMAYDFVNMSSQATHHFNVYSFFSETLFDYVESDVYARLDTPAGQALRDIVDPISYSARYATLPKLIISSTGDQSFVPDSSRFYLSELPGETKIAYIPNTDQNLDSSAIMDTLGPWYSSVIGMGELPEHSWEIENGNRLVVTPMSEVRSVRLWTSTSQNRDFRFDDTLNQFPVPEWTSQILNADGNGQYAAFINAIPGWWTGFLIQLEYDSGFSMDGGNGPAGHVPRAGLRVA
jgi:PhoPQ-activated pathogenicity-related protein